MTAEGTIQIDLDEYKRIISTCTHVVIYFTAKWCGPCKRIKPVFEAFERESLEKMDDLVYLKIDVDDDQEIANYAKIKSMPTFLFYKQGELAIQMKGANPTELKQCFDDFKRM